MSATRKADVLTVAPNPEGTSPLGSRTANAGRVLCLIGAALGAIGLLGWITRIWFLTIIVPGAPQMKANTAISLLLLGVAAALRRHETAPRSLRLLTNAAAVAVLAIGLGTLVEYASGVDLGIDQVLFKSGSERYPGRPSPPTALAVALLATALLLFDTRPRARARPPEWLIMAAGLVGFAAIVGAAFGAGPLYRMRSAPITGVAVPTAIGLLLVSAGMALERPAGGIARLTTSPGPGGALLRRLVVPAIAVPPLLAFGLSRLFNFVGIKDVALLFATLVASTTVVGLVLLAISAGPLERAHRALEATRSATRELVQQAPDGIFVADLEGRYTDVNRAGCEMLQFSREELVGKTIVDLIPAEDVGRLAASKQRLLEGESDVAEWRLRRKDGTYVPVELNAKILPDGRWQAFVRDITDRKRAEDALRASEARYSGLVSLAADAIISVDESQRIVIFNRAAEQIFGWKAAEVLDRPLDILIPERLREAHRHYVRDFASQAATARRMGARAEIPALRKDGEEFPAEASISKVRVAEGLIFTVVLRDVTEQRRVAREERFFAEVGSVLANSLDYDETLGRVARLAVGALADACIVESREDGGGIRRLTLTRRRAGAAGAGVDEPRGSAEVSHPLLSPSALQKGEPLLVADAGADGLASIAEGEEGRRALRALAPKSLIVLPLVAQGRVVGSLILVRTTLRYLPRDLFVAQELGRRAALAIENARLYRLAQAASQVRDDVLGIVAHDLRNPLAGIVVQAQMLLRKTAATDTTTLTAVERIRRAAARMNRLIQDLLDVTRIESGHFSIDASRQTTAQVIAEALEAQRPLTTAASMELRGEASPELPDVVADRDRLLQVFENLIGNAIKFASSGGRIIVGAERLGTDVLFWVADNGPGIPADTVAHLFDRFWQAKRADRRGAGLGLAIVKAIVEAHGGRTWAESTPGAGTTVFFTIPAATGGSAWEPAPAPHGP
jgi:PAS domain S-box-containing protein